ncbi:MAG: META domain-containing protein [Chloroflexi bacterium]|nr:META domain-containing protein [Chloroflexota bacterium]
MKSGTNTTALPFTMVLVSYAVLEEDVKQLAAVFTLIVVLLLAAAPLASAQDAPSLSDTAWTLVSIDGQAVLDGTEITLTFDEDGRAGGSAGCNSYGGEYTLDGDSLTFGSLFSTMMACEESIMQQESAYLAALQSATGVEWANGQLVITYGEGQELVFASALSLEGAEWTLVSIDGAALVDGTEITLVFDGEGVSGSAGCNRYSGSYTVDGDTLSFGPFVTTRMACTEAIMAQERAFLTALEAATAYRIADGQLVIVYGDEQELIFDAVLPVVTVTVTYRERIALPANAEITVTIEDVARADAPATVSVSQTIVSGGANVPFTFELPYDPAQLDDRAMYSVRAQIRVDGALWFTSDTIAPVLTRGAGTNATLVLVRVP